MTALMSTISQKTLESHLQTTTTSVWKIDHYLVSQTLSSSARPDVRSLFLPRPQAFKQLTTILHYSATGSRRESSGLSVTPVASSTARSAYFVTAAAVAPCRTAAPHLLHLWTLHFSTSSLVSFQTSPLLLVS